MHATITYAELVFCALVAGAYVAQRRWQNSIMITSPILIIVAANQFNLPPITRVLSAVATILVAIAIAAYLYTQWQSKQQTQTHEPLIDQTQRTSGTVDALAAAYASVTPPAPDPAAPSQPTVGVNIRNDDDGHYQPNIIESFSGGGGGGYGFEQDDEIEMIPVPA